MRFASLRRHWDRLARRDPYWAALTDPDKHGGRWDVDEFFKSGAAEIDDVLRRAEGLGVAPPRGRALDFGCGAGRLTQAMASQFARCDGVDISESMLRIARQQNRHADRCLYHVNPAPDLSLFADASFDFAYSTLVLQHMEPRYSSRYIRELVRVLSPEGLLVFQLPSQRSTMQPPADARRTRAQGRLPLDAFRARLTIEPSSLSSDPGQSVPLDVMVENRSPRAWPALPDANGHCQITVANRWLYEDDEVLQRDDGRCPLPHDLPPGGRTNVMLVVTAPGKDGVYVLELDVVQEDVVWFGDRGSTTLRVPFVVGNGLTQPRRQPKTAAAAPPPFRVRHPHVFRVLSATGVRDAYWAWRRAVDRVKTVRDRAQEGLRDGLEIPRLINWWRRGPFSARMEMHCVPRADVVSIVEDAGGHVVYVEDEWTPGFQSCRYWIRKGPAALDVARAREAGRDVTG